MWKPFWTVTTPFISGLIEITAMKPRPYRNGYCWENKSWIVETIGL